MPKINPSSQPISDLDGQKSQIKSYFSSTNQILLTIDDLKLDLDKLISDIKISKAHKLKEYDDLLRTRDKIIDFAQTTIHKFERDDYKINGNEIDFFELLVDNLFLQYAYLILKSRQFEDSKTVTESLNVSNAINQATRKKLQDLGFSYSNEGQLTDAAADNFEKNLPKYFANLPIGICIATGEDLIFQFANDKYLQIIDKDSRIIGQKISDIITDIDTQMIYESLIDVYRTGVPYVANEVAVVLNRYNTFQNAFFDVVCEPLREDDGKIIGIVVVCTEVTEITSSRKIMEDSEHKFKMIIDRSPVAKAILRGPELRVELANQRMLQFFWRRTLDQVQDKPLLEIFPELEKQVFPEMIRQVFTTGVAYSENNAIAYVDSADGRNEYIFDYEYAPLLDEVGNVNGVLISAYDVTDRVKSEQALKISENRFKSIASVMQQFIWTASPTGELEYFNQAVFDFSGRTEEDLLTSGWITLVHPDDQEENNKLWKNSVETGNDFIYEHRFRKANGDYRWQLSRAVAQRDNNGKILQWVGTSTDIHDQIKFQETLEELVDARTKDLSILNIELQSSNQDLESFAYISSHDLQEPLRKIQTFISIILDSDYENLSDRGKSYFLRVESAADRMKRLITDLLSYSRTSSVEQDFENVDLKELLEEIQGDFIETLEDKNGSLHFDSLPTVSGISFQLRQLFVNLISNSIKFSRDGVPPEINITSRILSGNDIDNPNLYPNQNYVEITLKDNGIGFSQEYAAKIFEVFQRLHAKGTYDGTGIGLAICKKIIDKHYGLIFAHSNPGEGAEFTIILPLEQ